MGQVSEAATPTKEFLKTDHRVDTFAEVEAALEALDVKMLAGYPWSRHSEKFWLYRSSGDSPMAWSSWIEAFAFEPALATSDKRLNRAVDLLRRWSSRVWDRRASSSLLTGFAPTIVQSPGASVSRLIVLCSAEQLALSPSERHEQDGACLARSCLPQSRVDRVANFDGIFSWHLRVEAR